MFLKEVNNCVCINPGRLVKGVSTGSYAKIIFGELKNEPKPSTILNTSIAMTNTSSTATELAEMYGSIPPPTNTSTTTASIDTLVKSTPSVQPTQSVTSINSNKVNVTFHKI